MGKVNLVTAIINLATLIIELFNKKKKQKDQAEHEEQVKKAKEDPASAFDEHFNNKKNDDQ